MLSPQDSVSHQIAKFGDYFATGCKLGWLLLPEEKAVLSANLSRRALPLIPRCWFR